MMTTYMKSVKNTFLNWLKENRTLGFIVIGMIAFPIAMALVGGVIALVLTILSVLFGKFWGTLIFVGMLVGGIAGYIASTAKPKEHGDYY